MARICPQCSQENYDQSVFCSRCGFPFSSQEEAAPLNNVVPTPTPPTLPDAGYSGYAAQANPPQAGAGSPQAYGSPQPAPAAGPAPYIPPPSQVGFGQPGGSVFGQPHGSANSDPYGAPGGGVYQQQFPQPNMQPPQGQQQYAGMQPPPGQPFFSPGKPSTSIRQRLSVVQRAFAGKGTPLVHTSWLLDGKQVSAEDMRTAIVEKVQQQYANEVKVSQEHLVEHESVLEERDYVRIERAPANVFIYVTSFGNDLYIARTTTVQPALSPVRIAVFGAMFLLMLIGFIISAVSASASIVSLFSALVFIGFVAIVIHSLVLGFTENDFLIYLRPNVLNDFRIDDGAILEHIADKGIRAAAEELALNTSALSAPAHNYPARLPLHLI